MAASISVGVPVFHGWEFIGDTLQSIQNQTYTNLEVLISIDGNDQRSAEACRKFLADSRFELVVQPQRLGWAGNTNWLLSRAQGDFFCYHQHDDLTDPSYFEVLLGEAAEYPQAAAIYSDVQWMGDQSHIVQEPSLVGDPMGRQLVQMEQLYWTPFLGLMRRKAIRNAGELRVNEHDSYAEDVVWIAKLACTGELRRIPQALYFKRSHPGNTYRTWHNWERDKKREAWIVLGVGLHDAALSIATSAEERLSVTFWILERLTHARSGRWMLYTAENGDERQSLVRDYLLRAQREGVLDKVMFGQKSSVIARTIGRLQALLAHE